METINIDKVVYQLTVEDFQTVAKDILKRKLTDDEIKILEEKIGDNIDWFSIIQDTIVQNINT